MKPESSPTQPVQPRSNALNKSTILTFAALCGLMPAMWCQGSSLDEQIRNVDAIHQKNVAEAQELERKRIEDAQAERASAEIRYRLKQESIEKERKAAIKRREEAEKARMAEVQKDKKRDQDYEDELRKLAVEDRKLSLQEKKARADRANEYIDVDLSREKARTDVVQSEADANRNVSQGQRELMTGAGKGAEAKGKSWF